MSNKYADLVKIIKQSRENIRPALQGSIFEREMVRTSAITGEEERAKALEEIKQRPQVRITDLQQKKRVVDEGEVKGVDAGDEDEVKEDVMSEEELQRLIEETTVDISKVKPKTSRKALTNKGIGQRYFEIIEDEKGKKTIVVFVKATRKGIPPNMETDGIDFDIPLVNGRLPLDLKKKQLDRFTSLLRKGKETNKIIERITEFNQPIEGKGYDPRVLIGAYLAKNNNKQLENLVLNKFLNM